MPQNTIVQEGISISQQTDADLRAIVPDRSLNIEKLTQVAIKQLLTYDAIVGSSQDVLNGIATHSNVQSAINAVSAGGCVLLLKGTYAGALSIAKEVHIHGRGRGSIISGAVSFTAAGQYGSLKDLKFTGNLTLDAAATGNIVQGCWQANGSSITEGTPNSNILDVWQE